MRMGRLVLAALAMTVSSGIATAQTVVSKGMIRFQVGDASAANAEILIQPRFNSRHVIVLNLRRAAKPGARLDLRVDDSTKPVYSTVLTGSQCREANGAQLCKVIVPGRTTEADAIVGAFKTGKVLHVDVMDGSKAMMSTSGSLTGFMAAFRQTVR